MVAVSMAAAAFGCADSQEDERGDLSELTPDQALARAREAVDAADGFDFVLSHVSGTTHLAGGLELQRAEGSVKRPGDMKLSAEANFGRAFVRTDAVVIGTDTWMTNPLTGNWGKIPPEESPFGFLDPLRVVSNIIENVANPTFVGEPGADGSVLIAGQIDAAAFEPLVGAVADTVVDVTLELDAVTFHLVRARIRGVLQVDDLASAERVIDLSGYDSEVRISPPI